MINNQKQFDTILRNQLSKCVLYLSDKILECLKQHITNDVYNFGGSNSWYSDGSGEPTWEFLNAFEFEGVKQNVKEVSNLLFYNWMDMSSPSQSNPYVHGNYGDNIDRRAQLASLLNVKGVDVGNDWGGKERNAFWDETIKEINQEFNKWAKEACDKYLK